MRITIVFSFLLLSILAVLPAFAQLRELSKPNPAAVWRTAQIASLESQLTNQNLDSRLKTELSAQREWLKNWQPGKLSGNSLTSTSNPSPNSVAEPTIDPSSNARQLRQRLFGPNAHPTVRDTEELQKLLNSHDQDVGLRQLHLHWLDQPQYRIEYRRDIVEACDRLVTILAGQPQSAQVKWATAYACFRRSRIRMLPIVGGESQKKTPNQTIDSYDQLRSDHDEIVKLIGRGHIPFASLEIAIMRQDGWYGQALGLLERASQTITKQEFLRLRLELLQKLRWPEPAKEIERLFEIPERAEQVRN